MLNSVILLSYTYETGIWFLHCKPIHALVMNAPLKPITKKGLKRKSCSDVMHLTLYSFMSLLSFNWMYICFHLSSFFHMWMITIRWWKQSCFPCKDFSLLNPCVTLLTRGHPLSFKSWGFFSWLPLSSVKAWGCNLNSGLHTAQELQINQLGANITCKRVYLEVEMTHWG